MPCKDPISLLSKSLVDAIVAVLGSEFADADPLIRPSQRGGFGDFQSNCAMGLAKRVGQNPRELAEKIMAAVDLGDLAEPLEIAGPGFINITLRSETLSTMLQSMCGADLGVPRWDDPHPVVVDLCGVNVAKQTHVGHLRSTIIGDALARTFERLGRTVHRENHLGDWGLPIAMVLQYLRDRGQDFDDLNLIDVDFAYRDAQLGSRADRKGLELAQAGKAGPHRLIELEAQCDGAAEATEQAKQTLVKLQGGDEELQRDWHKLIDCTLSALDEVLALLNVNISRDHNRGESMYRAFLPEVIDAAVRSNVATEDDGALVVRFEDRERPMLLRKSDGGFLYATTDLAAIHERVRELGASHVIYVVDARQRAHFQDVFDTARLMGWDHTEDGVTANLVHLPFGSVLGPNRKPLKTRSGENITLMSLLTEAIERGTAEVRSRSEDPNAPTHGLSDDEFAAIGKALGIGAVKYADLSNDYIKDYLFDFDRMIAFEGNTGPYLQYAHARVCSIFAKAEIEPGTLDDQPFVIREPAEKQLALQLMRYGGVVNDAARKMEVHRICTFLYELANAYSTFYQQCRVLKAEDDTSRNARLRLCDLVRRVLADGLSLLGIDAPQRM